MGELSVHDVSADGEQRPLAADADIAAIGALVADPARCRILLALADGRALPSSRLAAEAGVSAPTASGHLGKLTAAGLVTVAASGRHRYYRLAGPQVADLLERLQQLAPAVPVRSLRQSSRADALRQARSCYDHLAGRLGVEVMAALLRDGHLTGGDGRYDPERPGGDPPVGFGRDVDYMLTASGRRVLDRVGVPADGSVRYCVDWTEQRHHLSGGLGRALFARLVELDWIRRSPDSRAVVLTSAGDEGLRELLGVHLS
jgi:DNA-binding transcriptional ArsR family regulator